MIGKGNGMIVKSFLRKERNAMKKYMIVAILIGIALGGIWGASLPRESEKRENASMQSMGESQRRSI